MKKYLFPIILLLLMTATLGLILPLGSDYITETVKKVYLDDPFFHDDDDLRVFNIVAEIFPPYEYLDSGMPTGINVKILAKILDKLNVPYNIKFYSWAKACWLMKHGKADAILSISYTKGREQFLIFTKDQKDFVSTGDWPKFYFQKSKYVFFCRKQTMPLLKFESYQQIKQSNYKIGVIYDYSYSKEFNEARLKKIYLNGIEAGFRELMSNRK
jgi:hypothetical protein